MRGLPPRQQSGGLPGAVGLTRPTLSSAAREAALVASVFAAVALLLAWVGAPTPTLFAALAAAGLVAWRMSGPDAGEPLAMPEGVRAVGMALVGIAAGAHVDTDVLSAVARQPAAVGLGVLGTLAVSMLAGQVLRLSREVDAPTALFASIAGGASGVSLAARDFGADEAVVMSVQYLRVVFVLVTVPLVAPLLGDAGGARPEPTGPTDVLSQHLYTLTALVVGLALARLVRFSAAPILWTMFVASALAIAGVFDDARVPGWAMAVGFALVGAAVGLSFTRDRLARLTRLFPIAVVQVVLGVLACGVVGIVFARSVGVSAIDGYLATSPGGLPAVVAVAVDSGDELGLILTLQFVRVFVALALAPILGALLRRRRPG